MSAAPVSMERDGAVAVLTLNRPEAGNAIDLRMARALLELSAACDEDDDVRCVLLSGAGRLFCAGGDIRAFATAGDALPDMLQELAETLHAAIVRLARMNKPLITAVNGAAAGAGLSLAMLGDIGLAAPTAHFTAAYTAVGLSPDGGASWLLPRLIGLRRAQELIVMNERIGATDAVALGLITRVIEKDELASHARALAHRLAAGPGKAIGRTRQLLLASFGASLEDQLAAEARAIVACSREAGMRDSIAGLRRPD
jgi:2-(1,2-epoxy-1,2-dihydrophenyl)acetyl-CoA isomerase